MQRIVQDQAHLRVRTLQRLCVMACFTGLLFLSSPPLMAKESLPSGPHLVFDETQFDYGYRPPKQPVVLSHEFYFQNMGDQTLRIESLGKACKTAIWCAKRDWAPGEKGHILLLTTLPASYASPGDFVRQTVIESNDLDEPKIELKIKAHFEYTLAWDPTQIQFDAEDSSSLGTHEVTIQSRTPEDFSIKKISVENDYIEARLTSWTLAAETQPIDSANTLPMNQPLYTAILSVTVRPGAHPTHRWTDSLDVYTNRQDIPVVSIPINGHHESSVSVEPPELFMGIVNEKTEAHYELLVKFHGEKPRLKRAYSDITELGAQEETIDEGWKINLKYRPTGSEKPIQGNVIIELDDGDASRELRVPVRGLYKPLLQKPVQYQIR